MDIQEFYLSSRFPKNIIKKQKPQLRWGFLLSNQTMKINGGIVIISILVWLGYVLRCVCTKIKFRLYDTSKVIKNKMITKH